MSAGIRCPVLLDNVRYLGLIVLLSFACAAYSVWLVVGLVEGSVQVLVAQRPVNRMRFAAKRR